MFSGWFPPSKPKKKNDIPEKTREFKANLIQENMALVDKKSQLQLILSEKGRPGLETPTAVRLLSGMRRNKNMMQLYQTSLQALETTMQNLEMQRVSSEVQHLIGRAPRANTELMEDGLEAMVERDEELTELSQIMAQHSMVPLDNNELLDELGIAIPEEIENHSDNSNAGTPVEIRAPLPPKYLELAKVPTSKLTIPNEAAEAKAPQLVLTQPF